MQLIYLSPVPWSSFAQRPHKFVEWFHATTGGEVVWIEPYPTRLPQLGDLKNRSKNNSFQEEIEPLPEWLQLIKARALPLEPLSGLKWINRSLWQGLLQQIEQIAKRSPSFLVVGKPSLLALDLIKRLKMDGVTSLYDAMDDFPAFYQGTSRLSMAAKEQQLAHSVDTVLVSSMHLKKRWDTETVKDVRLVHNGLDQTVLVNLAPHVRQQQNTIFGYVGTIADWFDWEWVVALANARPDDNVVLIGPVFCPTTIELPANIQLLPPLAHAAAMQEMARFDIGLIPFKRNQLTLSVDPIKYYEYRALDIPVISTNFGEMSFRAEEAGVYLSDTLDDIDDTVSRALQYQSAPADAVAFMHSNSWESRFSAANIL